MLRAILIAAMINRPAPYVAQIYDAAPVAPLLGVSLVESEAWFKPNALHINWNEDHTAILSTDWGWWQLNDRWHPQYRGDLAAHARYGGQNLARVLFDQRYDFRRAIAAYNTGNPQSPRGLEWADRVLIVYERLRVMDWWPK